MTFEEALDHLKNGNIITNNNKDYHYIDGNRIVTLYFYRNNKMIITSDLENAKVLSEDWNVVSIEDENRLGLR
jgi:hypothetical protein